MNNNSSFIMENSLINETNDYDGLPKFIDQRYKKVNNIICYHKINS